MIIKKSLLVLVIIMGCGSGDVAPLGTDSGEGGIIPGDYVVMLENDPDVSSCELFSYKQERKRFYEEDGFIQVDIEGRMLKSRSGLYFHSREPLDSGLCQTNLLIEVTLTPLEFSGAFSGKYRIIIDSGACGGCADYGQVLVVKVVEEK